MSVTPFLKTFGEWIHMTGWEREYQETGSRHDPISHAESPVPME